MASELFRRRRTGGDVEMDITPMIDITFLLLIFFLVASRMDDSQALELPAARNGTAVGQKDSAVISLRGTGEGNAEVYLGEVLAAENRLPAAEAEQQARIVAFVEDELRGGKQQIIVRAEKQVRHREVDRVMKMIGALPEAKIYVAVLEES